MSAPFLGADWCAALVGSPLPGATAVVEVVVTGGSADVRLRVDVADGVVADASLGSAADADVVLTVKEGDAREILAGTLDPSVAFMQGRLKTAGDPGRLLDVLAATASPEWHDARERLAAATEP